MFKAFITGMLEFRSDYTTNFDQHDYPYELGRDFAHKLTLRRFEQY